MKKRLFAFLAALAMLVLILDTKTALYGASKGLQLCIQTLIPSLFPFFVISNLLTASLLGFRFRALKPLERLLRLPEGMGSLFVIGLMGGYPLGAQAVQAARKNSNLTEKDSQRMTAFCSNAGPAFLFGMGATLFPDSRLCWLLWGVHILSALLNGWLTPGTCRGSQSAPKPVSFSLPGAVKQAVGSMALVCGWVIMFRVALTFLQRWFLWLLPETAQYLLSGFLEFANGCACLLELENVGLRFTLCSVFLAFGGLCVALQTASVTQTDRLYLPGKVQQACIALLLCIPCQLLLAPEHRYFPGWGIVPVCLGCLFLNRQICKKFLNSGSILRAAVVQ